MPHGNAENVINAGASNQVNTVCMFSFLSHLSSILLDAKIVHILMRTMALLAILYPEPSGFLGTRLLFQHPIQQIFVIFLLIP